MALANTTKLANRCGLDLTFHKVTDGSSTTNDVTIDFANEVQIEVTGDAVYATGGQNHKRIVGFNNPIEGTMTISTQIVNQKVMNLITNGSGTTHTFKSDDTAPYYKITGTTLRKDDNGTIYNETITAYKAMIRPNYSVTYTGDGDPQSIDINIELFEDDTNGMISIAYADRT